jgi:hypothetical protein
MEPRPVNGGRRSVSQTLLVGTRLPNSRAKTTTRKTHHSTESYGCFKELKGRARQGWGRDPGKDDSPCKRPRARRTPALFKAQTRASFARLPKT